ALALQTLVTLDALVGGVAGLAFLEHDLDAVDAAIALVEQRPIVGDAVGERNAVRCIGARSIDQRWNELLLRHRRRGHRRGAERRRDRQSDLHHCSFSLSGRPFRPCLAALVVVLPVRYAPIRTVIWAQAYALNRGKARAGASPWRSTKV